MRKQFSWLWDYLVPMGGSAETVQGEVVRIAGRIGGELFNNGGRGSLTRIRSRLSRGASVQYVIEHPEPVPNSGELPYQR